MQSRGISTRGFFTPLEVRESLKELEEKVASAEAETFTFDGTTSVKQVTHTKGNNPTPVFYNLDGIIVYPIYTTVSETVIQVESNIPLIGILTLI